MATEVKLPRLGQGMEAGTIVRWLKSEGDSVAKGEPLYVMLDGDIAQTLGAILREDCKIKGEILVIDGVMLTDFDYIDLGRLRVPSYTVPVTIKSLIFQENVHSHGAHTHAHGHHYHHHERAAGRG